MNPLAEALLRADNALRCNLRSVALAYLEEAARLSWRFAPQSNSAIARAIFNLQCDDPKPRAVV